jgi:hypothetical protein
VVPRYTLISIARWSGQFLTNYSPIVPVEIIAAVHYIIIIIIIIIICLLHGAEPSEKLTGFQLVNKFPAFYGTRRFIPAFKCARHLSLS